MFIEEGLSHTFLMRVLYLTNHTDSSVSSLLMAVAVVVVVHFFQTIFSQKYTVSKRMKASLMFFSTATKVCCGNARFSEILLSNL